MPPDINYFTPKIEFKEHNSLSNFIHSVEFTNEWNIFTILKNYNSFIYMQCMFLTIKDEMHFIDPRHHVVNMHFLKMVSTCFNSSFVQIFQNYFMLILLFVRYLPFVWILNKINHNYLFYYHFPQVLVISLKRHLVVAIEYWIQF